MELQGKHLMEAIEHAVSVSWSDKEFVARHMLQVSGMQFALSVFNVRNLITIFFRIFHK